MALGRCVVSEFDVNGYNSHECDIHNHGYYLGEKSQQAKIDKLQTMVDEALIEMKHQLGDEDYYDMERPDYDAMLYALRNIKDILKGNGGENV